MSHKRKPCDVRRAERRRMERNVAFSKRLAYELDCRFFGIEPEGGYLARDGSDDFDPKAEVPVVPSYVRKRFEEMEFCLANNIPINTTKFMDANRKTSTEICKIEDLSSLDHVETPNMTHRADAPQREACATNISVPETAEQQEHVVFKHRPPEQKAHATNIIVPDIPVSKTTGRRGRAVFKHRPPEQEAHATNIFVPAAVEKQERAVFKHRPPEELSNDFFLFKKIVRRLRIFHLNASIIGAADVTYEYPDTTIVFQFSHFNTGLFFDDPDLIQCVYTSTLNNFERVFKYMYGSAILYLWFRTYIYGLAAVVVLLAIENAMITRFLPGKFRRTVVRSPKDSHGQQMVNQIIKNFVKNMPSIRVVQLHTDFAYDGILIPPCSF